jgi:hypothetical protein
MKSFDNHNDHFLKIRCNFLIKFNKTDFALLTLKVFRIFKVVIHIEKNLFL